MKIAIEAQRIFRRRKHGMDFVALETIRELQKIDHENQYRIYVAPGADRCLSSTPNFEIIELAAPTYPLWEQWALPRAVERWGADLLHCTSNTAPLRVETRLVITLHDVIFMEPTAADSMSLYQKLGRLYRRYVVPRAVRQCNKIVTVSNYERQQIANTLDLCPSRIEVIHNGLGIHFRPTALEPQTAARYALPHRFIFFLANTDPKKNTPRTMEAYALYLDMCHLQNSEPAHLVVADMERRTLKKMVDSPTWERIEGLVVTPGYINNGDLPQIYSAAQAFAYTSLRESFGIPLLEAMACGAPVISSDTSAIPEIAGHAALLVDPRQPAQIATALLNIDRPQMRDRGFEQVKKYSWESAAHQLLNLYTTIIQ